MGTLYVVGAPAGSPDDITRRALRVLREVALVVAENPDLARQLLTRHEISTPSVSMTDVEPSLDALRTGDVAILSTGRSLGLVGLGGQFVRAAIQNGSPVVPVPGPALPITALVISGLPADSFVYLGELPRVPSACRELLDSVANERRTLILLESLDCLPGTLAGLRDVWGDRPLVVVAASEQGTEVVWQGALNEPPASLPDSAGQSPLVVVVGGARGQPIRWDEERLRAEIRSLLDQGLGVKEISQQLTLESGWPRRKIYRLAVELVHPPAGK